MSSPKLSIIIPIYNTGIYLEKCLRSIQEQSFKDWECFLIDDGSTDESAIICDNFSKNDKRFITIHKKNGGVSSARNYGLNHISGEWVTFVDSDDWIEPLCYETALLHSDKANIIQWNHLRVNLKGDKWQKPEKVSNEGITDFRDNHATPNYFMVVWDKIFKSDIIKSNNLYFYDTQLDEDQIFLTELISIEPIVYTIKDALLNHLVRDDSLAHKKPSIETKIKSMLAWKKCKDDMAKIGKLDEVKSRCNRHIKWISDWVSEQLLN